MRLLSHCQGEPGQVESSDLTDALTQLDLQASLLSLSQPGLDKLAV